MIYEVIKETVESVEELAQKVFPAGACIDEVDLPIAVYTFGEQDAAQDLSGAVHHYTDTADIDLLADTYDQVHALYRQVERKLRALANASDGKGEYIFGVVCTSPKADAADLDIGIMRRTLQVSVQWCDEEE